MNNVDKVESRKSIDIINKYAMILTRSEQSETITMGLLNTTTGVGVEWRNM